MSWSILLMLRNEPEKLKKHLERRLMDPGLVDKAFEIDEEWRRTLTLLNRMRSQHNKMSRTLKEAKNRDEREKLIMEAKRLA
ncbi:MAG: serine--tRNA ligase, partial [Desulfurococcales archaeon]|nr:serine--tRNA ligase [Desulfurococcales archaeon]